MRLTHLLVLALCLLAAFLPASVEAQACTDSCPCVNCDQVSGLECRVIPGDLILQDGNPVANFPCLQEVEGDVVVMDTNIHIINLWTLMSIGGDFLVQNNEDLTAINIPSLVEVGGRIAVTGGNDELDEVLFLSLRRVGHSITIVGEDNLEFLAFPSLNSVGGDVGLAGDLVITGFEGDVPQEEGSIQIAVDGIERVLLQSLTAVEGSILVSDNDDLQELIVPSIGIVGGFIEVTNNDDLEEMHWWSLVRSGSFIRHSNNPSMRRLQFPALHTVGGTFFVANLPELDLLEVCDVDTIEGALVISIQQPFVIQGFCGLHNVEDLENTEIDTPGVCCDFWNNLVPWIENLGGLENLPNPASCSMGDCADGVGCCGGGPVPTPSPTPAPTTPAPTTPAPTTPAPTTPAPTTPAPTTPAPTPAPTTPSPTPAPTTPAPTTPSPTPAPTTPAPTPAPTTPAPTTPSPEPIVNCPPDLSIRSNRGQCGGYAEFGLPTVEGFPNPLIIQTTGFPSDTIFPVGCTSVHWLIFDRQDAELIGECEIDVCVEDAEAPEISCPEDQTWFTAECGDTSIQVTFDRPEVYENCCEFELEQIEGIRSGQSFPIGVTENVWEAEDEAGNTVRCTQNVEVLANPCASD